MIEAYNSNYTDLVVKKLIWCIFINLVICQVTGDYKGVPYPTKENFRDILSINFFT